MDYVENVRKVFRRISLAEILIKIKGKIFVIISGSTWNFINRRPR